MFRSMRLPFLFHIALSLAVCLCAAAQILSLPTGDERKTVTLTEQDDGGQVCLSTGDRLVVRLKAQFGTGYSWQLVKNDSGQLRPLGKPEVQTQERDAPGAAEYQIFRFEALAAGTSVLELHYVRPWEKDASPQKTFRVEVQIR